MAEVEVAQSSSKAKKGNESLDLEGIQADVASFAAQLGLASGGGFGSGFDDSDFRKTGRIGEKKGKKKGGEVDGSVKKAEKAEKVEKSPGGKGKKAGNSEVKDKEQKSKGQDGGSDVGLSFGSGKKAGEISKGKKRSLPSNGSDQGNERSAKKERRSEADSGNDGHVASKKVVALDRSLAKSLQSAALWYEGVAAAAANPKARADKDVSTGEGEEFFTSKRKEAEQLMEKAVADYEKSRSKDSDTRWLMTARRSGTSSDKVAAMTVMLQDNPMLNLRTLDALIGRV
jgi:ribosome biogenesis protein MAK21